VAHPRTVVSALGALVFIACSPAEGERPPAFQSLGGSSGVPLEIEQPTCEQPPVVDTQGTCSNETVQLFQQKPSIYFVLDISGSMTNSVQSGDDSKIDAAKEALITVASEIGHRVHYGLTVFPSEDEEFDIDDPDASSYVFGCAPGEEVFPLQEGDPIVCLNQDPDGVVLRSFKKIVRDLVVRGGTPLSPTLEELIPALAGQESETAVVLLTDGSPNCNPEAVCSSTDCEANRFGLSIALEDDNTLLCDENLNCCDPDQVGDLLNNPQAGCVDIDASERALEFLHEAGVSTYVIGVLGGRDFDSDMNRLAVAGGTARQGERAYFDVESLSELSDTVRLIGSELAHQCTIQLTDRPPQANELNVYLDGELLPWGREDGWSLDDQTVTLHGPPCDEVRKGDITEIQLVSGCRTVIR
jgi:hypothetical protein